MIYTALLLLATAATHDNRQCVYVYAEKGQEIVKLKLDEKSQWWLMPNDLGDEPIVGKPKKIPRKFVADIIGWTMEMHCYNTLYRDVVTHNGTNVDVYAIGIPAPYPTGMTWKYGYRKGKVLRFNAQQRVLRIK